MKPQLIILSILTAFVLGIVFTEYLLERDCSTKNVYKLIYSSTDIICEPILNE